MCIRDSAKIIKKIKASEYSFDRVKRDYKKELSNETLMQIRRALKDDIQ